MTFNGFESVKTVFDKMVKLELCH